jgi:hypothetical protein
VRVERAPYPTGQTAKIPGVRSALAARAELERTAHAAP